MWSKGIWCKTKTKKIFLFKISNGSVVMPSSATVDQLRYVMQVFNNDLCEQVVKKG